MASTYGHMYPPFDVPADEDLVHGPTDEQAAAPLERCYHTLRELGEDALAPAA